MKKNVKIRGKSIARRLNAALTRRSFAKTVLIDILAALTVLFTWCLTVEGASGGNLLNVSSRHFTSAGEFNIVYNTMDFFDGISSYIWEIRNGFRPNHRLTLPFEGIGYSFTVRERVVDYSEAPLVTETVHETEALYEAESEIDFELKPAEVSVTESYDYDETAQVIEDEPVIHEETVYDGSDEAVIVSNPDEDYRILSVRGYENIQITTDASGILTIVSGCFILLFVIQALTAVIRGFLGGGLIKQYLRPIDDIAMMAEQLSSESYSYRDEKNARENEKNDIGTVEQNEPVLDLKDVENLTDAIDSIADSRARIEVQASELSGLEAAINNMLKRLEESRRSQIRFVDDASHELRTPIAVIQGYANMLDRWGKDDPEIRDEAITAIKNESEHIKILLDQLLFLARGEMDRHVLEPAKLSVDLLLAEIAEESKMLDDKHSYEIITGANSEGREISAVADYAMLKQCIRILCDNSAKYTPEGGSVSLKAEERVSADDKGIVKREVCIEVADTGIGITAEELPRIFDRFFRSEKVRADNTSGSGLGLSIARWIAEQHHGRIEAISSPGIGTKMTVIIPAE